MQLFIRSVFLHIPGPGPAGGRAYPHASVKESDTYRAAITAYFAQIQLLKQLNHYSVVVKRCYILSFLFEGRNSQEERLVKANPNDDGISRSKLQNRTEATTFPGSASWNSVLRSQPAESRYCMPPKIHTTPSVSQPEVGNRNAKARDRGGVCRFPFGGSCGRPELPARWRFSGVFYRCGIGGNGPGPSRLEREPAVSATFHVPGFL